MSKRFLVSTLMALTVAILITGGTVWAAVMSSTNYEIRKITLEGSGGNTESTNYKAGFTVGQTVIGPMESAGYKANLGFWAGTNLIVYDNFVYLPIVVKNN